MKRTASFVVLLIALTCAVASTAAAQSASPPTDGPMVLVGKWEGTQVGRNTTPVTYDFYMEKSVVMGRAEYRISQGAPVTGTIQEVKIKQKSVTFEVNYSTGNTAHYQLTMEGDELKGWGNNYQTGARFTVKLERAPASISPPATK
jgi:hypothetical protein